MRIRLLPLLAPLLASLALVSTGGLGAAFAESPAPPQPKLEGVFLEFTGLDEAKGAVVEKAVLAVKGVRSWTWVARTTDVKIVREAGQAADATLISAATTAGATTAGVVPIGVSTLTFVEPLHCAGCMKIVTKALRANAAVKEVSIPESLETVTVVYDTRTGKIADFEKALADAARPVKPSATPAVK